MRKLKWSAMAFILLSGASAWGMQLQIRNAARPLGQRTNQLSAVSLVVGLNGTGDSKNTAFTTQALSNMLANFGINDTAAAIRSRNVAAVMVTTNLGPYLKNGDKIDVVVSSLGDATSLGGGVLIQTPLKAADGRVYAVAQGAVAVGGDLPGRLGSLLARGPATTGRVPNGGLIEADVPSTVVGENDVIQYVLNIPDYTSAARMVMAINETFAAIKPEYNSVARAKEAGLVEVRIPGELRDNPVEFMAALEQISFEVEETANKVVVNERTGTVVMGMKATIDTVAVAHGNLNVNIQVTSQVSQPPYFQPGASALYFNNSNLKVQGGGGSLLTLPESATVADLVSALNLIGATPRDLIAILQAIRAAGALHADLEIL